MAGRKPAGRAAAGKRTARTKGMAGAEAPGKEAAGGSAGRARPASNRSLRTRKDLLQAAARLLARAGETGGAMPSMEEVAAEALVSRATAYRYFPNVEQLLVEAALDARMPEPQELFPDAAEGDVLARIDRAEAAMHELSFGSEPQMRLMLAHSLQQSLGTADSTLPVRQNRRLPLIEAALAPVRGRLGPARHRRLCEALAVFVGPEAMLVFRDVLRTDAARARQVKSWAVRALVRAALEEAEGRTRK